MTLYDPLTLHSRPPVTGDRYPIENNALPSLSLNFAIPQGDAPREVWLRVETTSTSMVHASVFGLQESIALERKYELIYVFYLALLMLSLFYGLVHWVNGREAVMAAFVLKQAVSLMYSIGFLGYSRVIWPSFAWPVTPDMYFTTMALLGLFVIIQFDYIFLKELQSNRLLVRMLGSIRFFTPVLIVLTFLGEVRIALAVNNLILVFIPLLSLAAALSIPGLNSRLEKDAPLIPKGMVVGFYVLILVNMSLSSMAASGFIPAVEWSFNGYLIHALLSALPVVVMLELRAISKARQRNALELALQSAEQRVKVEERKREEQDRFLGMLTHELKTPLSVVRMVMGAPTLTDSMKEKARRSIEDMRLVLDRTLQVGKLESTLIVPEAELCSPATEVRAIAARRPDSGRLQLNILTEEELVTDVVLLRVILINLFDNALKYGASESQIDVQVTKASVNDIEGIAISFANLPGNTGWPDKAKIFQKYYRDPRAHKFTGSGLGLFLTHGLAQTLGGHLSYSPSDTHIIFTLWLPRSI